MCGDEPKSTQQSASDILSALATYGPGAIKAITDTLPYTAQKEFDVQKSLAPQNAALDTQIYGQHGPEINKIGNEINNQNQLAASQTELNLAKGPGADLVTQADKLQQQLDPEFYKSRNLIGDAVNTYLKSYNPTELTGSEVAQIGRGIASQQGGPVSDSALNTIKNAQTFGTAATQRWQNFGNAITQASSALPALKSGISGFEVATRRPLTSNTGEGRLSNPQEVNASSALQNNFGTANNMLSNITSTENANVAQRRTFDQRVNDAIKAVGSVSGAF